MHFPFILQMDHTRLQVLTIRYVWLGGGGAAGKGVHEGAGFGVGAGRRCWVGAGDGDGDGGGGLSLQASAARGPAARPVVPIALSHATCHVPPRPRTATLTASAPGNRNNQHPARREGEGATPQPGDTVEVHWAGFTKGYQGTCRTGGRRARAGGVSGPGGACQAVRTGVDDAGRWGAGAGAGW